MIFLVKIIECQSFHRPDLFVFLYLMICVFYSLHHNILQKYIVGYLNIGPFIVVIFITSVICVFAFL